MNAAVQTPARQAGIVRITGTLARQAELRMTTGEHPHGILFLDIEAGTGLPFEARQDVGADPCAITAAVTKQRQLRRGATVTVYARGITPRTDHHHAVLRLHDVIDVVPEVATPSVGPDAAASTHPEA